MDSWSKLYEMTDLDKKHRIDVLTRDIDQITFLELVDFAFLCLHLDSDQELLRSIEMKLDQSLSSDLDRESKSKYWYLKACFVRLEDDFTSSQEYLQKVLLSSTNYELIQLAKLRRALNYFESGQIHLAYSSLSDILSWPDICEMVRIEAMNAIFLLNIELGQSYSLREHFADYGRLQQLHFEMLIQFSKGESSSGFELLNENSELHLEYINGGSSILLLTDLLIGLSILDRQQFLDKITKSWAYDYIGQFRHAPFYSRLWELSQKEPRFEVMSYTGAWLTKIREYMIDCLIRAYSGDLDGARELFVNEYSTTMRNYHLSSLMLPYVVYGAWFPENYLSKKLDHILQLAMKTDVLDEYVVLSGSVASFISGNNKCTRDLSRSQNSLTILRLFVGPKGSRVHNESIFRSLYPREYDKYEHDKLIYKQLERLSKRLKEAGFPNLWKRPGDGSVEITCPIIMK